MVQMVKADDPSILDWVTLVKKDGPTYHVSLKKTGHECTCADFEYRRNYLDPRGCKHILALLHWGLLKCVRS